MTDNVIRVGYVFYHNDLVPKSIREKVVGGGRITIDDESKTILFHGKSDEYGPVHKDIFKKVLPMNDNISNIMHDLSLIMYMLDRHSKLPEYTDYKIEFQEFRYY